MNSLHLTIGEKILLHLLENREDEEKLVVSHALTQQGISKSLGIRQSHVSYELGILERKGAVHSDLKHILHLRRRRKAYFLTHAGYRQARELRQKISAVEITVIAEGKRERRAIGEIAHLAGIPLAHLLQSIEEKSTLNLDKIRKNRRKEQGTYPIPAPAHFYNREKEIK